MHSSPLVFFSFSSHAFLLLATAGAASPNVQAEHGPGLYRREYVLLVAFSSDPERGVLCTFAGCFQEPRFELLWKGGGRGRGARPVLLCALTLEYTLFKGHRILYSVLAK